MLTRETKKIIKLRRRIGVAYLIVFFLIVWIKNKYDDESYQVFQTENLQIEIDQKEKNIDSLRKELDSLKFKSQNTTEYPKLSKRTMDKKVKIEQKIDTIKKIEMVPIDTLQNQ